ncbi:hypothetical protein CFAM422_001421 [Trichoderma lentiforme]|uniref:Uncharacterized protein n=1 Tax=Trichoderma lentiforme TaxID=1567552 RepID=A0A9P4XNL9_9HYPO|nr:hypothetical protein CFAM422_001421 [Trichoderma lentiforme]
MERAKQELNKDQHQDPGRRFAGDRVSGQRIAPIAPSPAQARHVRPIFGAREGDQVSVSLGLKKTMEPPRTPPLP